MRWAAVWSAIRRLWPHRAAIWGAVRVVLREVDLRDLVLLAGLGLLYVGLRDAVAESVARVIVGAILIALAVYPTVSPSERERVDDGTAPAPARRSDARGRS